MLPVLINIEVSGRKLVVWYIVKDTNSKQLSKSLSVEND